MDAASLLLVLPSVEEGQGAVLLEALAAGTPVVGSNVDGIAEVITPQVGRLFPVADSSALAVEVNDLLAAAYLLAAGERCRPEPGVGYLRLARAGAALSRPYGALSK